MSLDEKLAALRSSLRDLGSLLVAFSGGVDSTFLLKVAGEELGEKTVAVTARSETYPEREYKEAVRLAHEFGVRHITVTSEELANEQFTANPPERCYYCKSELLGLLKEVAEKEGIAAVADGSNADDVDDWRPGMRAGAELGIRSLLREAGLTKSEIRTLSKQMGVPTWNKPSFACLSSRFPYGEKITAPKLGMVAEAEDFLREQGFRQLRVRHHDTMARIEVAAEELDQLVAADMRTRVAARLKEIGYKYVTVDLQGYRTGSMNEVLEK